MHKQLNLRHVSCLEAGQLTAKNLYQVYLCSHKRAPHPDTENLALCCFHMNEIAFYVYACFKNWSKGATGNSFSYLIQIFGCEFGVNFLKVPCFRLLKTATLRVRKGTYYTFTTQADLQMEQSLIQAKDGML